MRYFQLEFHEADLATQMLWHLEDQVGLPHTTVHIEARGRDTFMCVAEPEVEERLLEALAAIGANYKVSTEKPVLGQQSVS